MFEEKFSTICKLLYKLNFFDSVKCNVLPTNVCLHTRAHMHEHYERLQEELSPGRLSMFCYRHHNHQQTNLIKRVNGRIKHTNLWRPDSYPPDSYLPDSYPQYEFIRTITLITFR